jgi:hypothetical protein
VPAHNCFSQWVTKTVSSIIKSDDLGLDTSENPGPFPGVASDAPSDAMDVVSRRGDGSVFPGIAFGAPKPCEGGIDASVVRGPSGRYLVPTRIFQIPRSTNPTPDVATWPSLVSIPNSRFYIAQSPSVPAIPLSDLLFLIDGRSKSLQ